MVLQLAVLAAAAASPPPVKVERRARVSITVLQPYRASLQSWAPSTRRNQREVVKKEVDGTEVLLRLTEFE